MQNLNTTKSDLNYLVAHFLFNMKVYGSVQKVKRKTI